MTTVINREQHQTTSLPPRNSLTVTASATGVGSIIRLGDSAGDPKQGTTAIAAGETKVFGPFPQTTWFDVVCTGGSLTFEVQISDFPSVSPVLDRIVKLTQSEYDALSPPDSTTLYLVVG